MQKGLLDSIKEAEKIMNKVDDSFHGGLEHARKVVYISQQILASEPKANADVVVVSAWWHDTGRIIGNEEHEKRSALMASEDLENRGIDRIFCRQVYLAIAHHRYDMHPVTLEGTIIRDADKLALLDPKRWQNAIDDKAYHKFEHTINILPTLKNDVLRLKSSKDLYDKLLPEFLSYIRNINETDFMLQKQEILSLKLSN